MSHGPVAGRRHDIDIEYRMGLANVAPERASENQVLHDESLADVYRELFGKALDEYNERQVAKGHAERQIGDYLEHVRQDGKLEPSRELVVQIGNMYDNPAADETCRMLSSLVYRDWLGEFEMRFPHLRVYQASIHMDEATPHMHVAYVPWVDGRKRGLTCQNSLSGAYAADGFKDIRDANAEMFRLLEEACKRHGVERVDQGCSRAHMSVRDFKQVIAEGGAGAYPWCNDPRLVDMVERQLEAQEEADEMLERGAAIIEDLADAFDGTRPLNVQQQEEAIRISREFAQKLRGMMGARSAERKERRDLLDILARLKDWRNWLINPVSEAMRKARDGFASKADEWRGKVGDAMREFDEKWNSIDVRWKIQDREPARPLDEREEAFDDDEGPRPLEEIARDLNRLYSGRSYGRHRL